ncbi:MAG: hypothetical protein ACNYPI_01355 [Arenicellales bacterium WSBS_2016_MAG_OTU3]
MVARPPGTSARRLWCLLQLHSDHHAGWHCRYYYLLNSGVAETVLGNTPHNLERIDRGLCSTGGQHPPTVTLAGPTTADASDTTFAVTATFSKAVTGFDAAADITVTGGGHPAPLPWAIVKRPTR